MKRSGFSNGPYKGFSKPKKRMNLIGKETVRYNEFRDTIARPHLIEKFGNECAECGNTNAHLDVDHIKKRGSNPHLKYALENLQLLCRPCHNIKDNT